MQDINRGVCSVLTEYLVVYPTVKLVHKINEDLVAEKITNDLDKIFLGVIHYIGIIH
jgi:hypothetical protein